MGNCCFLGVCEEFWVGEVSVFFLMVGEWSNGGVGIGFYLGCGCDGGDVLLWGGVEGGGEVEVKVEV